MPPIRGILTGVCPGWESTALGRVPAGGGATFGHVWRTSNAGHNAAFLKTPGRWTVPFYDSYSFRVTDVSQAGGWPPVTSMILSAR